MAEVVIRLKRFGTKKKPHQRIVVMQKTRARDSRPIEEIGYYDPSKKPVFLKVDVERAQYWISKGAIPSPTIRRILLRQPSAAPKA